MNAITDAEELAFELAYALTTPQDFKDLGWYKKLKQKSEALIPIVQQIQAATLIHESYVIGNVLKIKDKKQVIELLQDEAKYFAEKDYNSI